MKYGFHVYEYKGGQIIPTIMLGDGTVGVASLLKNEAGQVGLGFYPAPHNNEVGRYIDEGVYGGSALDLNLRHQILFDNPASIDVVIEQLLEAKALLCAEQEIPE